MNRIEFEHCDLCENAYPITDLDIVCIEYADYTVDKKLCGDCCKELAGDPAVLSMNLE